MAKVQEQYEAEVSLLKDSLSQHSTVEEKEDRMKTEIDKLKSPLEKYRHQEQAAERKEIELSERIVALESQIQKSKEQSNKYNEVWQWNWQYTDRKQQVKQVMTVLIDRASLYIPTHHLTRLMAGENLTVEFTLMSSFLVYYSLPSSRFF